MELRTMRYFLAVAREENMTRAAELLHITQPTLSKQLKALEEELGKKLFIRHSFSIQVTEKLDKGIIDFAVLAQEPNPSKYHSLAFPNADLWGLVMPEDCPLAEKDAVYADDLAGLPLFCSEQGWNNDISKWCGSRMDQLHLEGSFRLSYNGSLFVKEGLGYLLTFEHLIDTNPGSGLVFRPLAPKLETKIYLIWKKYQVFTPIAERLLRLLKSEFSE